MAGRATDALLDRNNRAFGGGTTGPILNPAHGGQNGYFSDYGTYVSSTPHVRKNLVAKLIAVPRLFRQLPDSDQWVRTLKALIELHPNNWSGFSTGLEYEWASDPFGGAGEEMEVVANATRGRATPTANYTDKVGRPFYHFFTAYQELLIMEPETKAPAIVTFEQFRNSNFDLLPDSIGFTTLFFEPSHDYTRVDKAFLVTDMKPKDGVPVEASRDKSAGGELSQWDMTFTGITQHGIGPLQLAQQVMDSLNLTGTNPTYHPAFIDRVSADVNAVDKGFVENVNDMAGRTLQPR